MFECRWLIVLCAVLTAAGCAKPGPGEGGAGAGTASVAKIPVRLARVERADLAATIELVGSLLPCRRTVIVSEVDGVIKDLADVVPPEAPEGEGAVTGARGLVPVLPSVDLGTKVREGQPIVWLDPLEYELKLAASKAALDAAKRELDKLLAWRRDEEIQQAQAARDEAAARSSVAESDFERAKQLLGQAAISQAEFDRAEAELRMAGAELRRADAEWTLAKAGPTKEEVAVAEAAVARAEAEVTRAQWEVDRTIIKAPYDGVVTDRYVDEGERVTAMPRVEIMEIMDLASLFAQLGVPERHIGQIQIGDPAAVYVKGSVDPVRGVVALINDKVDPASRTFRIKVAIQNDGRRFKVGQFVRVVLQLQSSPNALTVPAAAIAYTGGEAHVFVFEDGRARERAVVLGVANADAAEVLAGLAEGEPVVVDDPSILSDGMEVEEKEPAVGPREPAKAS